MTRRLAAVPDEVPEYQCLLCGEEAETYVDLCDRCAAVFAATAARVAAATIAARTTVVIIPGQLALENDQ